MWIRAGRDWRPGAGAGAGAGTSAGGGDAAAGARGAPCDPRQGHIPGARLLELSELLGLSPQQLQAAVGVPPGVEVIAYCHSGSRSQVAVAALRSAGYEARNYVASWHAWSRDESLPAETGR